MKERWFLIPNKAKYINLITSIFLNKNFFNCSKIVTGWDIKKYPAFLLIRYPYLKYHMLAFKRYAIVG